MSQELLRLAVEAYGTRRRERGSTRDASSVRLLAYLANDGEDERLASVVAVSSDAEVDLLVERVSLVVCRECEDGIGRRERGGREDWWREGKREREP